MKRANPAVIGGFIVGAVVLAIAGVMIFGSGKLFAETIKCVMYFEGAIQGLHVGAPDRRVPARARRGLLAVPDVLLRLHEPLHPGARLGVGHTTALDRGCSGSGRVRPAGPRSNDTRKIQ